VQRKARKERIRNLCALCGFIFAAFARNFFHAKQYKMNAKKSDDKSLRSLTFFPSHKATKGYVFATFAISPLRPLRETSSNRYVKYFF